MSTFFTSVVQRTNGDTIDASWSNALRTAGMSLEAVVNAILGGGTATETTLAIANNQLVAANITGMLATNSYRVTRFKYWVKRIATATVIQAGELIVLYDGVNFSIMVGPYAGDAGIVFDINASTGQITYTTDNMAGSYDTSNSKIGWTTSTQG